MSEASLRLYLDQPLAPGQSVALSQDQAHYLSTVMRQAAGSVFLAFNGRDGEWQLRLIEINRRRGLAVVEHQTREQGLPPDLWLLFAPIKKARTDFIVEKAVEMGAARILPVMTAHTNSERIRQDRLQAHAREAAEQCGATFVPPVAELTKLGKLLTGWPEDRRLAFCDESAPPGPAFANAAPGPWALLIGPEGGFSGAERAQLLAKPFVTQIRLGPRILRADTAAVAALALWQNAVGDWR
ncbi:16S rRNA (uracil(1498)-N(3))-methyltransferase [Frigidibacter sp. ROC022]|uniref:16S rRNA (uracil(1498)-N(3))-methyltransferase n=1 Tax=Frigidibacter sp. ROC022 TaxID=2971796 RepID=UPI00215AC1C7|nr:16S rRNA (uracil(1498)-N(3))-methyltransferase [Frigidibacter sp. ROC022]MCR8726612.1 16S rRNA (uracil(1498)-N(3))-methyltransferase [Frigidibacter sp. ROC022]